MPEYDLLLKGGHVIDPANDIDAPLDVAVANGKVAKVAPDVATSAAAQHIDVSGLQVTPGLIDMHVHVYHTREPETLSVIADHHCFRSGVTTVVDTGTAGAKHFLHFKRTVIDRSKTRIFAYINIVKSGMIGPFEQDIKEMDPELAASIVLAYPEDVRRHQDRALLGAAALRRGASALGGGRSRAGSLRDLRQAGHDGLLASTGPHLSRAAAKDETWRYPHPCLRAAISHPEREQQTGRLHV